MSWSLAAGVLLLGAPGLFFLALALAPRLDAWLSRRSVPADLADPDVQAHQDNPVMDALDDPYAWRAHAADRSGGEELAARIRAKLLLARGEHGPDGPTS